MENISFKMSHLVRDVVDEIEEFNSDRNVSSKNKIGISVMMLDEDQIVELEKFKGERDLQAISKIDFLVKFHEKEGYGGFLNRTWNF